MLLAGKLLSSLLAMAELPEEAGQVPMLADGLLDAVSGQFMGYAATNGNAVQLVGSRVGLTLLIVTAATTFIYLLHSLAGSRTGGIMLLFVCSVAMVYLSGGIVPSMFLPEVMQKVGARLPAAYLIQAAGGILTGSGASVKSECVAALCGYTVLFGATAYFVRRRSK